MERVSDELGAYGATEKHQAVKSLRRRRIAIQAGEKRPRDLVPGRDRGRLMKQHYCAPQEEE